MNRKHLALHLLHHLARAQRDGRRLNLAEVIYQIKVRRCDVRTTLTALDQQGFYDVLHNRLTLAGFAIGMSLKAAELPALRPQKVAAVRAA
jgi:DNA-binding IclR family transcriptional regulator